MRGAEENSETAQARFAGAFVIALPPRRRTCRLQVDSSARNL